MANQKFRRIGILTSGGDAPGMNPCFRAITRAILSNGTEAMGIRRGYKGLIDNDMKLLTDRDVSNIINIGGTSLYSDRCLEFKTEEGMQKAVQTCRENKIDGIIAIGGDGTFRGARDLTDRGIPCIGIPATIDNDISSTDYTIGFDTALNTVVQMVDRLRDTCESHARCDVVEVMGNGSGYLALHSGIAVGATEIISKEIPFSEDALIEKMLESKRNHKRNFIIVVSENMGAGFTETLTKNVQERTGIETRYARLSHVQRGGSPTHKDRMTSSLMAFKAVELLYEGKSNLVIRDNGGKIESLDISFALDFDKYYKGKFTEEQIAKIPEKDLKLMEEMAKKRREQFMEVYRVNSVISN
ncbi:MAG: 6-phosphofructokinase [Ruminococcaceae bacterium]|nr:6-phosphofructokinase [Oscillospiraceae bacterium]